MPGNDRTYFEHRAEIEAQRAREATEARVARVHDQLAQAYLGKLAVVPSTGAGTA
ncbi:hypothetical protein [uncultured Sphingomonas sp.]|uniref:hypothetical protein n=1 Tax=uncultured Sphingomonas sp. TaxID=158754 RepID=UPI0035CA8BD7